MAGILEDRYLGLVQAASECGSLIASAVLLSKDNSDYQVQLPLEEFISVFRHCRPRMLYVVADQFEARAALVAYLEIDEEDEEEFFGRPEARAMIKRVVHRDGELASLLASFVFDGVLHSVFEQTKWLDEFESRADELDTLLANEGHQQEEHVIKITAAKISEQAKALCAHVKFNDGRPSKEKRIYLARFLFPDLDRRELHDLVEEATNMDWLKS